MNLILIRSFISVLFAIFLTDFSCFHISAKCFSLQKKASYWKKLAENHLIQRTTNEKGKNVRAKNIILFVGDGMGIASVSAARIYRGQLENLENDQDPLIWETFPYAGLVKTHSLDKHVTDSSASAVAFLSGAKVVSGTVGVDGSVNRTNCANDEGHRLETLASKIIKSGRSVGLVTNMRVTHATPAALYAHTAERRIESDYDRKKMNITGEGCIDLAQQLINEFPGNKMKVILGGGRVKMTSSSDIDVQHKDARGQRLDGRNLIEEWKKGRKNAEYVWNRQQLLNVNLEETDHLMGSRDSWRKLLDDFILGLFEPNNFNYRLLAERDNDEPKPTLSEMTETAIKIMRKCDNGYFLLVESGMIDYALHSNYAKIALDEILGLEKAVGLARRMTKNDDTLIIVTADHSHSLTMPGYIDREKSIFAADVAEKDEDIDGMLNTMLVFANGPSAINQTKGRRNLTGVDTEDPVFQQPSLVPLYYESHSGEDVGIWADGPGAHLFTGTMDNTYISYAMQHSFCMLKNLFTNVGVNKLKINSH